MNETDQLLHERIHQQMMSIPPDKIFSNRVGIFDQLEDKLGLQVSGTVLDIGCGSGYASIWLAKNKPVNKVYAQEASSKAVEELLPRNIEYHQVEHIVEAIEGSFDAIPFNNALDYVISFGALHHSPCLFSTMKSIARSLKDDGYLIAQEPVMPNTTSNAAYIDKYNIIENRFGMEIRNGSRNDNFFREAEYITAAAFSGLDLMFYEDFKESVSGVVKIRSFFTRKTLSRILDKMGIKKTNRPHMPEYTRHVMRKVFVFRKKNTEYIPHVWRGLNPQEARNESQL